MVAGKPPVHEGSREKLVLLNPATMEPTEEWLTQALFWADSVATIVPDSYASPRSLRHLRDQGLWQPAQVQHLPTDVMNRLSEEAIDVVSSFVGAEYTGMGPHSSIRRGKLPYMLEFQLRQTRQLRDHDGEWLRASDSRLVPTLLSICAAWVCHENGWRISIDSKTTYDELLSPIPSIHADPGVLCCLRGLPRVSSSATLGQVVRFRTRHEAELLRFRQQLARVESAGLEEGGMEGALARLEVAALNCAKPHEMPPSHLPNVQSTGSEERSPGSRALLSPSPLPKPGFLRRTSCRSRPPKAR